jgi:opacity protein-like surface antigen
MLRPNFLKGTILTGAALMTAQLAASGAWAQCTDNFVNDFPGFPASAFMPLGNGSSLAAFTSTINTINTAFLTNTSAFVSAPGGAQVDQQGAGAWTRAVVGEVDAKSTSSAALESTTFGLDPGKQTCHTRVHQNFWGYQVGQDLSVLNAGGTGSNWHYGVTAGAFGTTTKDTTPAGSFFNSNVGATFTTPAGSFREESQIPFVGLYAAYTKGNLFLDAQARWDFYQNALTDPNNGLSGQRLDARGFSLTGNAGYQVPLKDKWFIEPSAGVVYSHVSIDPLSVPGIGGAFLGFATGQVTVNDIDSLLGRASLRIGTSVTQGNVTWQPYFTASVIHEFMGDVTATALAEGSGGGSPLDGFRLTTTSTGGVGTYGQFALGTAVILGNTGWLGYGRVDYRVGENIEGWDVTAGLRYQFSPSSGGSIKDGPSPVTRGYNWTGAYVGALAGTTWADMRGNFITGEPNHFAPDMAGTVLGGQVGYNLQSGRWVVGIEGDYAWSNAHGGVSCPNAFFFTCQADIHALSFLTGRLGTTWGRALFYAKGGLAAGEVEAAGKANTSGLAVAGVATTDWQLGWTAGGGMEFALTDRWSAKAEYMYYDLGTARFQVSDFPEFVDERTRGSTARIGLNYHLQPIGALSPLK